VQYFELLVENFEEVCEPFEYETESAITEMREFISLGKGINKAQCLSRLIQDYIYTLTGEDDNSELAVVKDETPHTRYVAVDPENTEDRTAA
jgi:hypothetical protein